jgi:hypothetical protein
MAAQILDMRDYKRREERPPSERELFEIEATSQCEPIEFNRRLADTTPCDYVAPDGDCA